MHMCTKPVVSFVCMYEAILKIILTIFISSSYVYAYISLLVCVDEFYHILKTDKVYIYIYIYMHICTKPGLKGFF
jgi:hypothetical protein